MDRDRTAKEATAEERRGWEQLNKTANFQAGPGTIAGCIADGVGHPDKPYATQGQGCGVDSSPNRRTTRSLMAEHIAKMREMARHQLRAGERAEQEATALEALLQSLPAVLGDRADEGLRLLLGYSL